MNEKTPITKEILKDVNQRIDAILAKKDQLKANEKASLEALAQKVKEKRDEYMKAAGALQPTEKLIALSKELSAMMSDLETKVNTLIEKSEEVSLTTRLIRKVRNL